jgi:hypothetical protein
MLWDGSLKLLDQLEPCESLRHLSWHFRRCCPGGCCGPLREMYLDLWRPDKTVVKITGKPVILSSQLGLRGVGADDFASLSSLFLGAFL